MSSLAKDRPELRIGEDRRIVLVADLLAPDAALGCRLLQRRGDDLALVDTEKALGIAHPERPRRHQHPVADREQKRERQEKIDGEGGRRVSLLEAAPFMAGREIAGVAVALLLFFYRHGLSSSRRIDCAARSKRLLLVGQ